jgi:hypothetical protein
VVKALNRDFDGSVIPYDEPDINDEDEIIRRISLEQTAINANGQRVLSSKAFKASSGHNGGMSVDIKKLIEEAGVDPVVHVTSPRWLGSVLFKVSDIRHLGPGYMVGYDPIIDAESGEMLNPFHGEVWGRFSRGDFNQVIQKAEWFVPYPDCEIF